MPTDPAMPEIPEAAQWRKLTMEEVDEIDARRPNVANPEDWEWALSMSCGRDRVYGPDTPVPIGSYIAVIPADALPALYAAHREQVLAEVRERVKGVTERLERIRDLDEQTSGGALGSLARYALDELAALDTLEADRG